MIYAVVLGPEDMVLPEDRVRGYYTEEYMAQEHADFLNKHEKTITYRKQLKAKVITVEQERDKEKAAHE